MKKDDIRRRVKAHKALLDDNDKSRAAGKVFEALEQTADFMLADRILMYHSLPDELSTHSFIDRWSTRKHFYLPRVNGLNLEILPYDESRLALGSFHIEEPTGNDTTDIDEIELIVVPAVAYDRLLARSSATRIGVGYDFQLIEEGIEADPHDVLMDVVITESHTLIIRRR